MCFQVSSGEREREKSVCFQEQFQSLIPVITQWIASGVHAFACPHLSRPKERRPPFPVPSSSTLPAEAHVCIGQRIIFLRIVDASVISIMFSQKKILSKKLTHQNVRYTTNMHHLLCLL